MQNCLLPDFSLLGFCQAPCFFYFSTLREKKPDHLRDLLLLWQILLDRGRIPFSPFSSGHHVLGDTTWSLTWRVVLCLFPVVTLLNLETDYLFKSCFLMCCWLVSLWSEIVILTSSFSYWQHQRRERKCFQSQQWRFMFYDSFCNIEFSFAETLLKSLIRFHIFANYASFHFFVRGQFDSFLFSIC